MAFYTFNILCFIQGTAEQKTQFSDLIVLTPGGYKGQDKDTEILDKPEWFGRGALNTRPSMKLVVMFFPNETQKTWVIYLFKVVQWGAVFYFKYEKKKMYLRGGNYHFKPSQFWGVLGGIGGEGGSVIPNLLWSHYNS